MSAEHTKTGPLTGSHSVGVIVHTDDFHRGPIVMGRAGKPGGGAIRRVVLECKSLIQVGYQTTQHDSGMIQWTAPNHEA